ncbi:acetyl-CoA acetyltransferase [Burkholderia sp. USMB20]|uniref:acetyl-CoA acetyltransferase n=1 Tax=Burkholderia sp. USMB20 TaxID=1571773 RepID=UPI0005CF47CE|nr:acetyl-CoA acetyltransferase [Burkholderia sp. USMB20]TGN92911.1 thiolase domain-containing protein [Burkholderia sp. USMB20]
MTACMVGWAHTRFGKFEAREMEDLIGEVVREAMADACVEASDIDEIFLGTFNAGFVQQDFPSSLVLQCDPALRFKPATRIENACATGSAAIQQGLNSLKAGTARHVLVIGVEKMSGVSSAVAGENLLKASYVKESGGMRGGFAGVFGTIAETYFGRYGNQLDALAAIAAKNHRNGARNPYAHMQKDLGFEFCREVSERNPVVAGPLKRTDCALISDGAAAVVLADKNVAITKSRAVAFRATSHVNDFLSLSERDVTFFDGAALAWRVALEKAGVGIDDLDFAEIHDCFTISELIQYETMGLVSRGEGKRAILDGMTDIDGKLPINPSGGLKARGHPVGATGVSMHVMAAMQLTQTAGPMQLKNAQLAGVFNMGGCAVANYASVLERVR